MPHTELLNTFDIKLNEELNREIALITKNNPLSRQNRFVLQFVLHTPMMKLIFFKLFFLFIFCSL